MLFYYICEGNDQPELNRASKEISTRHTRRTYSSNSSTKNLAQKQQQSLTDIEQFNSFEKHGRSKSHDGKYFNINRENARAGDTDDRPQSHTSAQNAYKEHTESCGNDRMLQHTSARGTYKKHGKLNYNDGPRQIASAQDVYRNNREYAHSSYIEHNRPLSHKILPNNSTGLQQDVGSDDQLYDNATDKPVLYNRPRPPKERKPPEIRKHLSSHRMSR